MFPFAIKLSNLSNDKEDIEIFTKLEKTIDSHVGNKKQDSFQAYYDILSSVEDSSKTEIYFQMKYLIEETKISCTKIIQYLERKFPK